MVHARRWIMTAETRAVIDAVLEALDIPYAATVGHDVTRQEILNERLTSTLVALRALVAETTPTLVNTLEWLRSELGEHPADGYVTKDQAHEALARGASWLEAVALPDAAVTP